MTINYNLDGSVKSYAKECGTDCPFYRSFNENGGLIEVCGGGVNFKFLVHGDGLSYCTLIKKDGVRSVQRIDRDSSKIKEVWRRRRERLKTLEVIQ